MTSTLSVESLRQQLAIEESSTITDTTNENTISSMECLRSPTTRTVLAIIQNKNHYDVIKDFVLEAQREEKATQELIDAAEEVQAIPIASAFADALKGTIADDTIQFRIPRNAAGDVLGIKPEDSAILQRWGRRPPRDGDSGYDHTDDLDALHVPIGQLEAEAPPPPPDPRRRRISNPNGEIDAAPMEAAELQVVTPPPKKSLKELLAEQKEELKAHDVGMEGYKTKLDEYFLWQKKRMDTFDALLQPSD